MADELNCFRNPTFLRSTWNAESDEKIIAFAGRSNAGKSSILNTLCGGRFARTARTPGRTRMVNLFALRNGQVFADLPGYGYAAGNRTEQQQWGDKLSDFMCSPTVIGAVLAIDCRRGIGARDMLFLQMCADLPLLILMNKSDKLGRAVMLACLREARRQLDEIVPQAVLLPFSALKKQGVTEAGQVILSFWQATTTEIN